MAIIAQLPEPLTTLAAAFSPDLRPRVFCLFAPARFATVICGARSTDKEAIGRRATPARHTVARCLSFCYSSRASSTTLSFMAASSTAQHLACSEMATLDAVALGRTNLLNDKLGACSCEGVSAYHDLHRTRASAQHSSN